MSLTKGGKVRDEGVLTVGLRLPAQGGETGDDSSSSEQSDKQLLN